MNRKLLTVAALAALCSVAACSDMHRNDRSGKVGDSSGYNRSSSDSERSPGFGRGGSMPSSGTGGGGSSDDAGGMNGNSSAGGQSR